MNTTQFGVQNLKNYKNQNKWLKKKLKKLRLKENF